MKNNLSLQLTLKGKEATHFKYQNSEKGTGFDINKNFFLGGYPQ